MILFLILFLMSFCLLVAMAIRQNAVKATEEIKKNVDTGMVITWYGAMGDQLWDGYEDENGVFQRKLKEPIMTMDRVYELLELDGVSGFHVEDGHSELYTGLQVTPGLFTKSLKYYEKEYEKAPDTFGEGELRNLKSYEKWSMSNGFQVVAGGSTPPYFANGAMEMVEGRFIERGDSGKVVISEKLAEKNQLKTGDSIEVQNVDYETGELYGSIYKAEIVGVFRVNFEEEMMEERDETDILQNRIFCDFDLEHWRQKEFNTHLERYTLSWLDENERPVFEVVLYLKDAKYIRSVQKEMIKLEGIDWDEYWDTVYDADYQAMAKPLLTMIKVTTALTIILAAGIAIVLYLLFMLWIRSRKKEIEILVQIGMKKWEIISQFIIESLLIAMLAFILSGMLAKPVAESTGDTFGKFVSRDTTGKEFEVDVEMETQIVSANRVAEEVSLDYDLSTTVFIYVFSIMAGVIVVSVTLSSVQVIKKEFRIF